MKSLVRVLLLASLLLPAGMAHAVSVYQVLGPDVEDGFGFSWIHKAERRMRFDGTDYYPGGEKLYRLSGSFRGEWVTANEFHFLPSRLTATGVGSLAGSGDWDFDILGGALDVSSGRPLGTFDYRLSQAGYDTLAGTFVVDPVHFAGLANSATATDIAIWSNNWYANQKYWDQVEPHPGGALGIDLRGVAPIPAPSAILAFALGAAVAGGGLRRHLRR